MDRSQGPLLTSRPTRHSFLRTQRELTSADPAGSQARASSQWGKERGEERRRKTGLQEKKSKWGRRKKRERRQKWLRMKAK